MMYFSANGWQAVLYALIAGLEAGIVMMLATWLKRHCLRWVWMITDALCGLGIMVLFARALWQGTEGIIRGYMMVSMLGGMLIFRGGPQAILEALFRRKKR